MGARQSKRSVDISGTPKKGELENGGAVEEGRLERIEEGDLAPKVALNGTGPHVETPATEEAVPLANGDHKVEPTVDEEKKEVAEEKQGEEKKEEDESIPTEQKSEETTTSSSPDKSEKKKKDKPKKKWSFRSISFSRKDKTKPSVSKEDSKNGEVEPVAEVVETEAAAVEATVTEAIPVKDGEKKEEAPATPAGEDEKKEESPVETTPPATEAAPVESSPSEPAPAAEATPAPAPTEAASGEPAPAPVAEAPVEAVKEADTEAAPTPAPEAVPAEPAAESTPAPAEPVVESVQESEPIPPAPAEVTTEVPAAVPAEVIAAVVEEKLEEVPPPLPASPPPTEAPPPTPVAPTPAPPLVEISVLSNLGNDTEAQENDVAGGGGESMAELPPGDVEPVLDVGLDDKEIEMPLVNGISEETQKIVCDVTEKISVVKTLLTEETETHLVTESTEIVSVTQTTEE